MGNSGSMHNLASLDAQYHQHQNQHMQQPPQQWAQSFPRQTQPQFKVLPDNVPNSRILRTTNNGAILSNGGTLTNRKEIGNGVKRSRSISNSHNAQYSQHPQNQQHLKHQNMGALRERSRTQLNMLEEREARIASYKRFGSEPDLRISGDEENTTTSKGKVKLLKGKKKKAAPAPPNKQPENDYDPSRFGWKPKPYQQQYPIEPPQRKLRLFKTKAESKKPQAPYSKMAAEASDQHFAKKSMERPEKTEQFRVVEQLPHEPMYSISDKLSDDLKWEDRRRTKVQQIMPQFRREKSFDVSLLRSKTSDVENYLRERRQRAPSPTQERRSPPKKYPAPEPKIIKTTEGPKNLRKIKEDSKEKLRKVSQPSHSSGGTSSGGGNSFQQELLAATKRRSLVVDSKIKELDEHIPINTKPKEMVIPHTPVKVPKETTEKRKVERTTNIEKQKPVSNSKQPVNSGGEPVTKNITNNVTQPAPSKTFYFGMSGKIEEKKEQEIVDGVVEKTQLDVIDRFAESLMKRKPVQRMNESSESALSSDVDDSVDNIHQEIAPADGETVGISLQLRPTLPKKQFEIPRFSPAAAWRLLSPEEDQKESAKWYHPEKLNLEPYSSRQLDEMNGAEDRIERIYRDPIPGLPDNKSGDSGISGDAGLPEREETLRHKAEIEITNTKNMKNAAPYLSAWTPQQDLEETSSDDAEILTKPEMNKLSGSRGHVFSLSLPRETHLAAHFSEKSDKQSFTTNSLQKLKKTVSGAFSNGSSNHEKIDNVRSDNWLLSRSAPNSIDNVKPKPNHVTHIQLEDDLTLSKNNYETQFNSHHTNVSIKPPSFSYLAGGKHMMYLPNHTTGESDDTNVVLRNSREYKMCADDDEILFQKNRQSLQDLPIQLKTDNHKITSKSKNHRFTFQSTVRQIERRRIADKLSREAEEKEAQRLSESEAMRRVEEEFQKKRAREKASIRQQLRLYSMEENHCVSLPVEWSSNTRADPDGAVSSPNTSPNLYKSKILVDDNLELIKMDDDSCIDTKTPYISRIVEQKSSKHVRNMEQQKQHTSTPPTEVLSEFHSTRREYLEYRSNNTKRSDSPAVSSSSVNSNNRNHPMEHPTIVCNIPSTGNGKQSFDYLYGEPELQIRNDNYRKEFARRINSSDSELSGPSLTSSGRVLSKQNSRF